MNKIIQMATCTLVTCGLAVSAVASEPKLVGWGDLAPEPVTYSNPFNELDPDQLKGLRKLLRFEQADGDGGSAITPEEAVALRTRLETDGLDVDWLFEQRRIIMEARQESASGTNDALVGQSVRIPGYLLPLEIDDQKAVEFLLVPTVGACIHTPAPPPNQMVYVRYPAGFEVQGLYTPIWVKGKLLAESKKQTVSYVDGEARVETSYIMTADSVEPY